MRWVHGDINKKRSDMAENSLHSQSIMIPALCDCLAAMSPDFSINFIFLFVIQHLLIFFGKSINHTQHGLIYCKHWTSTKPAKRQEHLDGYPELTLLFKIKFWQQRTFYTDFCWFTAYSTLPCRFELRSYKVE